MIVEDGCWHLYTCMRVHQTDYVLKRADWEGLVPMLVLRCCPENLIN